MTSVDVESAMATVSPAGQLADGTRIDAITLAAPCGITARILTFGATLQSLLVPDRAGQVADVLLGHDDLAPYVERPNYFGVTVGRYANRIAGARFTLDGTEYHLPCNDGPNCLHGGPSAFDRQPWRIVSTASGAAASVELALRSPDGDAGFPGSLEASVTYSLDRQGALTITMTAQTDRPTVVSMTNHAIFNLAGEGSPDGTSRHVLTIPAAAYTPVDATLIPTGELRPVAGSVFDFRTPRRVAEGLRDGRDQQIAIGRGYDHNFVLDKGLTDVPGLAARLEDPESGRVLEVLTTEPGIQLYAGNFLDGTHFGKQGHLYRMGDGIALEPQKFPNAPNEPRFASARIDADTPYRHVMIYRFEA